jgi:hypothetical protein
MAVPAIRPKVALPVLGRFDDETPSGGRKGEEVLHIVQNVLIRNLERENQLLHGPRSFGQNLQKLLSPGLCHVLPEGDDTGGPTGSSLHPR